MLSESIKTALGAELAAQVEEALKGKGKEGKDIDLVVGNDGSFVPITKYETALQGQKSAETTLAQAVASLKDVGGSGDPAKIADDVKAVQASMSELTKSHKAELANIQRTSAVKMALTGKVHDATDIMRLIDMEKIEVDDTGTLKTNLDDLVKPLREAKPYLFMPEQSTQQQPNISGASPASAANHTPPAATSEANNTIRAAMGLPTK